MTTVDEADRLTRRGVPIDPTLRILAVATLVNTMGNGVLMTTSALYFTHVIGLSPTQVGAALAVAAAVALLCQVPSANRCSSTMPPGCYAVLGLANVLSRISQRSHNSLIQSMPRALPSGASPTGPLRHRIPRFYSCGTPG